MHGEGVRQRQPWNSQPCAAWHIAGVLTKHVEHIPKVEADCSNMKDDFVDGCAGGL
jgi:hypothetical protein